MRRFATAAGMITGALMLMGTAFAQGTPPAQSPATPGAGATQPGLGPETTQPQQVDKSLNMVLPSAGQSKQSAAPTMVHDCQKRPQDCSTPATPADKEGASRTNPIKP